MSKLAFFFMSLVGAVPAGGALFVLIRNLLDRADTLGTVLLAITITATVCTSLVVLTPFIVLVFYKDTRPALSAQADEGSEEQAAATDTNQATEADGFGDVIPDDFDENELAASADDEEDYESFDDDAESYDDEDFGDYDEEYEEFDEDEEL